MLHITNIVELLSLPTGRLATPVLGDVVGEKMTLVCTILAAWAAPEDGGLAQG